MMKKRIVFAVEEIDDRAHELVIAAGGRIDDLNNGRIFDPKGWRSIRLVEMPQGTECDVQHGLEADVIKLSFSMNDGTQVFLELETSLDIGETSLRFVGEEHDE